METCETGVIIYDYVATSLCSVDIYNKTEGRLPVSPKADWRRGRHPTEDDGGLCRSYEEGAARLERRRRISHDEQESRASRQPLRRGHRPSHPIFPYLLRRRPFTVARRRPAAARHLAASSGFHRLRRMLGVPHAAQRRRGLGGGRRRPGGRQRA